MARLGSGAADLDVSNVLLQLLSGLEDGVGDTGGDGEGRKASVVGIEGGGSAARNAVDRAVGTLFGRRELGKAAVGGEGGGGCDANAPLDAMHSPVE